MPTLIPPPTLALDPASDTGISHTDGLTRDTTPTITGTATPGDTVTLLDRNGIVLGTAIADTATGAWSIVSAPLAEGPHTLTATDTVSPGNLLVIPGALSVTIDTTAPAAPATPVLASNVPIINGTISDTTPTITGTAAAGDTVTLLDSNGTMLGTAMASTTGAWSIVSAPLAAGTHALTATDTDAAGNTSSASSALPVTINTAPPLPTPPPTLALDPASDTGISHTDGLTRDTTPTITGTATPGDTVTLLDRNGIVLGTAIADTATGAWSIVSAPLAEGPHTLTATDTVSPGNLLVIPGALSVTIDTTAPAAPATPVLDPVSDTGISNTDGITRDTTPTITGTAAAGDTVTLLDSNGTVRGKAQADATGAWSIVSATLAEGVHILTATDTDMAGNTSAASGALSVTIDTTVPAAPPPPVLDPGVSNINGIIQNATPTITGTATPGDTVTLQDTNGTTVLGTALADTTGAWSIVSAPLAGGAHTLTATDTNTAGNTSAPSGILSVTLNTAGAVTPPTNPGVSIAGGITAIDPSTGQPISVVPVVYSGPVAGIQSELITVTSASLNITVTTPNVFIHSGSGNDALTVTSGNNILDGGGGSNFLTGGTGSDTFFIDTRGAPASIWSTVGNFHTGDSATMWGVSPANFIFDFEDNQGAAGYTGLTLNAIGPNSIIFSVTFAGLTRAALSNGTISQSVGFDPVSGSTYTYFHANA